MAQGIHEPVLLGPALEGLNVRPDGFYVDGTFGRGGHSAALLERLNDQGTLWMLDRDPEAVAEAERRFGDDPRCRIHRASFADLAGLARAAGVAGHVDGLFLDLGVSSPQLDDAGRGFSFMREGPLDMRMDPDTGVSARQWIAEAPVAEMISVFRRFGEERFAPRIARAIARAREEGRLPATTMELAALVDDAVPRREVGKHPATRVFQAIRIHINGELEALETLLRDVCDLLAPAGRLVVISFHSLEDRLVKRFMRDHSRVGDLPPGVPVAPPEKRPRLKVIGKARRAESDEVERNVRARSAVLRVAERLP